MLQSNLWQLKPTLSTILLNQHCRRILLAEAVNILQETRGLLLVVLSRCDWSITLLLNQTTVPLPKSCPCSHSIFIRKLWLTWHEPDHLRVLRCNSHLATLRIVLPLNPSHQWILSRIVATSLDLLFDLLLSLNFSLSKSKFKELRCLPFFGSLFQLNVSD